MWTKTGLNEDDISSGLIIFKNRQSSSPTKYGGGYPWLLLYLKKTYQSRLLKGQSELLNVLLVVRGALISLNLTVGIVIHIQLHHIVLQKK